VSEPEIDERPFTHAPSSPNTPKHPRARFWGYLVAAI
jgi:hypothetical protein